MSRSRVGWAAVALGIIVLGLPAVARADNSITGPSVTLDRSTVHPGDHVVVTMIGFTAQSVTISVCGNEARRGSSDCNMGESTGVRIDHDGTDTKARMPIVEPPVDCPCVIRVSSPTNDEVGIAPIDLVGHTVGPLVNGTALTDPLDVAISVEATSQSFVQELRPSLGGPATYRVTVTIRNTTTFPLSHISVFGAVGRNEDDNVVTLGLVDPGVLEAGKTWTQVITARVPTPSFGDLHWHVAVSGAGPTVTATKVTNQRPTLLLVVAMIVVINVGLLLIRHRIRVRAWRDELAALDAGDAEPVSAAV